MSTNTFPVDAAGSPIEECPTTVRVIVGGETGDGDPSCSWCSKLAEYAITEDHLDFVEVACQEHRERYWITPVSLIKRPS